MKADLHGKPNLHHSLYSWTVKLELKKPGYIATGKLQNKWSVEDVSNHKTNLGVTFVCTFGSKIE